MTIQELLKKWEEEGYDGQARAARAKSIIARATEIDMALAGDLIVASWTEEQKQVIAVMLACKLST